MMDWLIGVINGGGHCLDGVNGLLRWWSILLHLLGGLLLVLCLLLGWWNVGWLIRLLWQIRWDGILGGWILANINGWNSCLSRDGC